MKRKFAALLLAIVMVVMMLPMTMVSVFAEESETTDNNITLGTTEKNITLGATALQGAQKSNVYYGTYKQSSDDNGGFNVDPIKWRVLSNGDGKLFLLADQNLDVFQYNTKKVSVTWATSTMRSWLNGYEASKNGQNKDYTSDNFIKTAFSTQELTYILQTTLEDAGNNTDDYVFLLSFAEVTNKAYGFSNKTTWDETRESKNTAYVAAGGKLGTRGISKAGETDYWWLRSIVNKTGNAMSVLPFGYLNNDNGNVVNLDSNVVRPAFNLNLSSVLFTTAVEGGYKLTMLDASRSGFSAKILKTANKTYLEYQGATTGTNEYITAMIVNANGEVTYYGSLKSITENADASGIFEIDLSDKMNSGDKLYILNEQYNGDYNTDYASALNEVTVPTDVNAYSVNFNANGGTGTMDDAVGGDSYILPKCGFTYVGYSFEGWSYTADGEVIGTASVEITEATTLYAVWISNSDVILQLDKDIKDLEKALEDGDKDLSDKITALTESLDATKAALEATDAENKAALEAKIAEAQTTLQAAIDKVAADLSKAITDLNTAITNGDTELSGKITELTKVLNSAKDALEATDATDKEYLEGKITAAQTTLQTAIDALSSKLDATNEKVAQLETFIIIVCIISGVAFCGCGALAGFYFVDKKKK